MQRRKVVEMEAKEPLEDSELLREMAMALVTKPDRVRVRAERQTTPPSLLLRLRVDKTDTHRIIGRSGRVLSAVRNVFSAIGRIDGRSVTIQLDDP
jgi:predicted RNA-binding protein YlqC (UPF0109 family)